MTTQNSLHLFRHFLCHKLPDHFRIFLIGPFRSDYPITETPSSPPVWTSCTPFSGTPLDPFLVRFSLDAHVPSTLARTPQNLVTSSSMSAHLVPPPVLV